MESEPQIIRRLESILTRFCPCVDFDNLFFNSAYPNPLLRFATDVLLFRSLLERLSMPGDLLQALRRVYNPISKSFASPIISVFRNKTFSAKAF